MESSSSGYGGGGGGGTLPGVPDRPVQALLSSLRPVNLNSAHSTPPVFTCIVTDHSTGNGRNLQVSRSTVFSGQGGVMMVVVVSAARFLWVGWVCVCVCGGGDGGCYCF